MVCEWYYNYLSGPWQQKDSPTCVYCLCLLQASPRLAFRGFSVGVYLFLTGSQTGISDYMAQLLSPDSKSQNLIDIPVEHSGYMPEVISSLV